MRSEERCDDERQAGLLLESLRGAAPGPILGSPDEPGPQRLLLDFAARAQQVRGFPEAPELWPSTGLPRGYRVPLGRVPALHVGMRYPIRQPRDPVRVCRASDQMPLGGHEAIGNESDGMTAETLAQNREKPAIVMRLEQHVATARLAVHHVKEILRSLLIFVLHATTSPGAEKYSKPDAAFAGGDRGAPTSC
jgi:hypothetical protein